MNRCPVCLRDVPLLVEGSDLCIACDARMYPEPLPDPTPTPRRVVVGHAA